MTLKSNAKFEEKVTCGSENDMRNLANLHQSARKSQNWDFDGILLSEVMCLEIQQGMVFPIPPHRQSRQRTVNTLLMVNINPIINLICKR